MGVPKFFRYMSERYPCLNQEVREYQIPEFDNLYLDMNGIIHVCSHPDDNPLKSLPEETIFRNIFNYIELMFRLIQPKKLFMMAVDGVAPRAKMNQQRARRFTTARDAEIAANRVIGADLSALMEERFDSNCITPGTEFMDKLHQHLQFFIVYKISTDKLWRRPKIILSGHDTPGEGEHKIMDYIRYLRSRDDYQPNTRHCLHGLDADLIILGLCSHELHFSLLREEVKFGRNQKRPINPEEIKFFLLHLSLMRDYLDMEFQELKTTLPFPYNLEKVIDDWVLMGFLVGNDFIPNLPLMQINENALHRLYQIYISVLPSLGGYINENGILNLERFQKYMEKVAQLDLEHFQEAEIDLKYFESKMSKKLRKSSENENESKNEELMNMINETKNALCTTEEEEMQWDAVTSEENLQVDFEKYKAKYYMEKMHYEEVTEEVLRYQAECYIRAIQWNLHYYYRGCPSWSWHYPHHYAPFISDIRDFCYLGQLEFDLGQPFKPFQQLLSVLPPGSRSILPEPFRQLMTSPESPLLKFYPKEFQSDLNGKQNSWEAVVLLPFIDQESLVAAMEPYYDSLTRDEKRRNTHGPMTIYEYTWEDLGVKEAPDYFPPVLSNHAKEAMVWLKEIMVPKDKLKAGVLPGARESSWYGFPSLKYLEFTGKLKHANVQVFQQPSRGLNMMLYLKGVHVIIDEELDPLSSENKPNLREIADKYLGKEIYVNWPHIVKAFVNCVTNLKYKYTIDEDGKKMKNELSAEDKTYWPLYGDELVTKHKTRMGIVIGKVEIIIFAQQLVGFKYEFDDKGNATMKLSWSPQAMPYPLQTIVDNINVLPCEKMCGGIPEKKTLNELFPEGQIAFLIKPEYYGDQVKVLNCTDKGRIDVDVQISTDPNIDSLIELEESTCDQYYQGSVASVKSGLNSVHVLSRITGSIFIQMSETDPNAKVNIGLNMKFNKLNVELVGYTKKINGRHWNYSSKAIKLIQEYAEQFPDVIEKLRITYDINKKADLFKEDADAKILEIVQWLANHPYNKAEKRSCRNEMLSEIVVNDLEMLISSDSWKIVKEPIKIEVRPDELILPVSQINLMEPDIGVDHRLFDRVVNIRECHSVPLGLKGFIIGIEKHEDDRATLYDIIFDTPVINGFQLHTNEKRCYRFTKHGFLNLSHGCRLHLSAGQNESNLKENKASISKSNDLEILRKLDDLKINSGYNSKKAMPNTPQQQTAKMEYNLRPEYNSGANNSGNNVTKFFSAYRNPNVPDTVQQIFHGYQQSPRRQQGKISQPNANSEFQAMWNHLQNQKVPADNSNNQQIPSVTTPTAKLTSAANEQTNALRKILKLQESSSSQHLAGNISSGNSGTSNNNSGNPVEQQQQQQQHNIPDKQTQKTCNHFLSCCSSLINYCQMTGCTYPIYNYLTNNITKEITAVISFPDGLQFKGLPCKDKPSAAESVACFTLKGLSESKQLIQGRPMLKMGPISTSLLGHPLQYQPLSRLTNQMTNLPSPPQQWCVQQNKRENWRVENRFQDSFHDSRPSPSIAANSFVPLQAQLPRGQAQNKTPSFKGNVQQNVDTPPAGNVTGSGSNFSTSTPVQSSTNENKVGKMKVASRKHYTKIIDPTTGDVIYGNENNIEELNKMDHLKHMMGSTAASIVTSKQGNSQQQQTQKHQSKSQLQSLPNFSTHTPVQSSTNENKAGKVKLATRRQCLEILDPTTGDIVCGNEHNDELNKMKHLKHMMGSSATVNNKQQDNIQQQQQTHQQPTKSQSQRRSKSRLAARFSKPLN